ncbi:MAG: acyl carrier protein [Chitinophagales bacterium]|nr:acyl carrier protein [Chitinophagales bacterium]
MNLNDFIKIFTESFDEISETLTASTKYKELENWTSMQALLLIAHIDDTLNVVLDAEDIKNTSTIAELFDVVKSKM